jgi:hypothetical protein
MNRLLHEGGSRAVGRIARLSMIVSAILLLGAFPGGGRSEAEPAQGVKSPASKWIAQMPEGVGKNLIVAKCQFCHTLQPVVTARRTKDQWTEAIDSMTQMGAPVTGDEAATIVDYLTANFGPAGLKPPIPASTGVTETSPTPTTAADRFLVDPDQAQFSPVPDSMGSLKGVEMFVVSGDPLKRGPFSVLLKISGGAAIPPGWLSGTENIVCLRGKFQVGEGDALDASNLQALNPGAVLHISGQTHHFHGQAKDGAVILVYGEGPLPISEK